MNGSWAPPFKVIEFKEYLEQAHVGRTNKFNDTND